MKTCGARPGGPSTDGIDLSKQTVIQGQIIRDGIDDAVPNGTPVSNGHVRLLDATGEFTAEVPTNNEGQFRFFASPGTWTLVVQAPGARVEKRVVATRGSASDLVITI
ncbi:MAG: hypothetical protein RL524_632 [Actinomycetota bacterium]|jgi:hypothetical protein